MTTFRKSPEFIEYLGETAACRPQDQLLPLLDMQNDQIYLAPGEVYCRFRHPDGRLCSSGARFCTRSNLTRHYRIEHNITVAHNATISHSTRGKSLIVAWYRALLDGYRPSWRARDEQFLQSGQADQPQADEGVPKDS